MKNDLKEQTAISFMPEAESPKTTVKQKEGLKELSIRLRNEAINKKRENTASNIV